MKKNMYLKKIYLQKRKYIVFEIMSVLCIGTLNECHAYIVIYVFCCRRIYL